MLQTPMKFLWICCYALILSACASTPVSNYRPAKADGPGYREIMLDSTSYRVQFKIRGNQRTAATQYGLQRAAELTLDAGYDWFIVSKQKRRLITEDEQSTEFQESFRTGRCSLLGCTSRTYRTPDLDTGIPENYTLVLLDIHMGRGIRPEKNSYDAQETWDKLTGNRHTNPTNQ